MRVQALKAALFFSAPFLLALIFFHILWGLAVAGILFPVLPMQVRDALIGFWSRLLLLILGLRLELRAQPGAPSPREARGALLLINHISWVDVFVVAAATPARFVAKSEIARWPLAGRFAAAVGTIFVERGRRHAVAHVNEKVAQRLRDGVSIGIFPEGTTTQGDQILPFHANLVQSAIEARAPVVPVGLHYLQDERTSTAAAFVGQMNLMQSLWRILLAPRLAVRMHWLAPVATQERTRHEIANECREAILRAITLTPWEGG